MNRLTFKDNEISEYIEDSIKDWKKNITNRTRMKEDLHYHLFNEDYYIIGTYKAEKWLGDNAFKVIDYIKEYENDNFGAVNTDFSSPEAVVNMFAYIRGEELLAEKEENKTTWRGI